MTVRDHVPPQQRAQALELVRSNPGRRAAELTAMCESVLLRAWILYALRELNAACLVRIEDGGRYFATG